MNIQHPASSIQHPASIRDPETDPAKHLFTEAVVFWGFAFWSTLARWWELKRVCAWYHPPRYLGGNPFAKRTSHGICRACYLRQMQELNAITFPPAAGLAKGSNASELPALPACLPDGRGNV